MISPRAALIYKPNDDRTFKFIYNKSTRRATEFALLAFNNNDIEDINYFDLIYQQKINDNWSSQLSAYHAKHNLIAYSSDTSHSRPAGQTEFAGFDWELGYKSNKWKNSFSASYVKLIDFDLTNPDISNPISALPQGFGNDFADVPNWTLKLQSKYKMNNNWELNSSLVSYLGIKGKRDLVEGLRETNVDSKIDDGALRLNLGAKYTPNDNTEWDFNAHNIAGWFDRDLNKRVYQGSNFYRPDVPSVSVQFKYSFK